MFLPQVQELPDREVVLQPFVGGHGHHPTEEKTYSPTEDHHLVVILLADLLHEEDRGHHHRAAGLAVHLILRDTVTSLPTQAGALPSVKDDFLQTGSAMIDHQSEIL